MIKLLKFYFDRSSYYLSEDNLNYITKYYTCTKQWNLSIFSIEMIS